MGRRVTRKTEPVEEPGSGGSDEEISNTEEDDCPVSKLQFRPCTKKLFVLPKVLDQSDWAKVFSVTLSHPRTQRPAVFLIDDFEVDKNVKTKVFVYEVLNFDPSCHSWFIDDDVCSNGNLRIVTTMDPLFLILPAVSNTKQAKPLEDHICELYPPRMVKILCEKLDPVQLELITEKRVAGDVVAYAFSEQRALRWLEKKVRKTVEFIAQKSLTARESSVSANFIASSADSVKASEAEYLEYACEIIGEYLEIPMKKKLLMKLGLPTEPDRKRKTRTVDEGDNENTKKLKAENSECIVEPLENYGTIQPVNPSPTSTPKGAKAKSLLKAAQGSHSLLKFFAPKS